MTGGSRSPAAALGLAIAALMIAGIAPAFACTNLATMSLSVGSGHVGDTIILSGTSFPVPRANSTQATTPVVIRWKTSDGPILATLVPDRTGSISTTFSVPPAEPGNVVIFGIQRRGVPDTANPDAPPTLFVDEAGTPARATFRVLAAGEFPPPSLVTVDSIGVTADEGSTAMIVLMVLFGAVALSLFAGGVIAFLHQVRSRSKPVAQPWPPW